MDQRRNYSLTLFQAGDKLRAPSLYHLLKGKRTSSVLMYGYLHQLLPFFGLFPKLEKQQFEAIIIDLVTENLVEYVSDNHLKITHTGVDHLQKHKIQTRWLDGVNLANISKDYFAMLLFITQVLSELSYKNNNYIPIEVNQYRQSLVKSWLNHQLAQQPNLISLFHDEWSKLIKGLPTDVIAPDQMVSLMTGHDRIGSTYNQLRTDLDNQSLKTYLMECQLLHYIGNVILTHQDQYPIFYSIFEMVLTYSGNHSAKISYQLFRKHRKIESVMRIRGLKKSTVVDHLIEGLILDDKNTDFSFISKESFVFLSQYQKKEPDYKNWKFADFIDIYPGTDFFIFRAYQIMIMREAVTNVQ